MKRMQMKSVLDKLKVQLRATRLEKPVKETTAKAAPGGRLLPPAARLRTHRVYCGLDFGTCSCKVVVQIDPEHTQLRRFLALAHTIRSVDDVNVLLCPSTVGERARAF